MPVPNNSHRRTNLEWLLGSGERNAARGGAVDPLPAHGWAWRVGEDTIDEGRGGLDDLNDTGGHRVLSILQDKQQRANQM